MADKSLFSLPLDELDDYTAGVKESKAHLDAITNQWKAAAKAIKDCEDAVSGYKDALKAAQAGSGANDNLRDRIGPPPSRNDPRTPPRAPPRQEAQSQFKGLSDSMKALRDTMTKQSMVMARQLGSYAGAGTGQAIGGVENILSSLGKSNVVAAVVSMAAAAVTAPMLAAFAAAPEMAALRKQVMSLSPNAGTSTARAASVANSWMADPMSALRAQSDARRGGPGAGAYALGFGGFNKGMEELNSGKSPLTQQYDLLDKIVEPMKGMTEFYKNSRVAAFKDSGFTKEDIYAYERMGPEERAEKRQIATQVEAATRMSPEDERKWQFFYDKMKAAGEMMEGTIIKKLTPLTGPLSRLMDKFEGAADDPAIEEFIQAIADAFDSIKQEDIQKAIHDTAEALRTLYGAAKAVADFLNKWTGADMQKKIAKDSPINIAHYIDKKYTEGGEGQQVDVGGILGKLWNKVTDPNNYGWKDKPGLTAPPTAPVTPPPPFHQPAHPHTPTPVHHWYSRRKHHAQADMPTGSAMPVDMETQGTPGGWTIPGRGVGGALMDNPGASAVGATGNAMLIMRYLPMIRAFLAGGGGAALGGIGAAAAVMRPTPAESGELQRKYWPKKGPGVAGGDMPSADAGAVSFETGNVGGGWKVPGKYEAGTLGGVQAKQTDEPVLSESRKQTELLSQIKDSMDKAAPAEGAHGGVGGGHGVGFGGGGGSGGGGGAGEAPTGSGAYLAGHFGGGGGGAPAGVRMRAAGGGGGAGPSMTGGSGGGYSGGRVKSSKEAQATAKMVAEKFRAAGASDEGIAGMFKNVQDEGGFGNAGSRHFDQPKFRGTEAENAHGLWQMGGTEWNEYDKWMKKNRPGGDWKDPANQTDWQIQNLQTRYPDLWKKMKTHAPAGEQAGDFTQFYERPSKENLTRRKAEAARGVPGIEAYTGGAGGGSGGEVAEGGKYEGNRRLPNAKGVWGEKNADPRIADIVSHAAEGLPPGYKIQMTSAGRDPSRKGFHPKGMAEDYQIVGPDGKVVNNRGWDETGLYKKLAKNAYGYQEKKYPGLTGKFQWGGQFGTAIGGGGVPDLMHFDTGGRRGHYQQFSREAIGSELPPEAPTATANKEAFRKSSVAGPGAPSSPDNDVFKNLREKDAVKAATLMSEGTKEAVQAATPNRNIGWGTEATGGKAGSGGNRGWGTAASRGGYQGGSEQTASSQPLGMTNWQLQPKTNVNLSNKTGGDVHISASTMAG